MKRLFSVGVGLSLALSCPQVFADQATSRPAGPGGGLDVPQAQSSTLAVRLELVDTTLTRQVVFEALRQEFGSDVVQSTGAHGLHLLVKGRVLEASFEDKSGTRVERALELPEEPAAQIETIALLSGNLARDEAGTLLSELRAKEEDLAAAAAPSSPSETEKAEDAPEPPTEASSTESGEAEPAPPADKPPADEQGKSSPLKKELDVVPLSVAFYRDLSAPKNLDERLLRLHLGIVYSEIGSLDGFSVSLIALRNLGRGAQGSGQGVQVAPIWLGNDGYFRGFSGTMIASTHFGGLEGVQAGGIFAFQKNETLGAQLGGAAAVAMSDFEGVQLAGAAAFTWGEFEGGQGAGAASILLGDLSGVQGAGAVALTSGNAEGVQAAGVLALVAERMDGVQMAPVAIAQELDGAQVGVINMTYRSLDGFQVGGFNVAGDTHGSQFGLINIGGNVSGSQVGLLNIAKDVDGIALAPVNIVPGIRNQLVAYGSWAPSESLEGTPSGPLGHVGVKFMSDPLYTQLTFGLGQESEECSTATGACVGGGVEYAPGFAIGGRIPLIGDLFSELDVQYQLEKAFSAATAHRHAVLGRAALGYEFSRAFALYAGGGPRLNIRVPSGAELPEPVTVQPHVFAGIQVF